MKLHYKIFPTGTVASPEAPLHVINDAATPGVSQESPTALSALFRLGTTVVGFLEDGIPAGFINLVEPGVLDYDSPNLRWFERWQAETGHDLVYVDRIAIRPDLRNTGLGEALYQHALRHFSDRGWIGCEVNQLPPNPGSHRFHQRLGFSEVGEQVFDPGAKAVTYYARPIHMNTGG